MKSSLLRSCSCATALFLSSSLAAHAVAIIDPGQGVFALSSGATGAAELSGLTYAGGTTFHAVGDNGALAVWTLDIAVNSTTGQIVSGAVTGSVSVPGLGSDSEGIAYRAAGGSVFVADEVASTIREFSLVSGALLGSVAVPAQYAAANVQGNFGLESLSLGGGSLWTANEEALTIDGSLSTTAAGSWVRLQRFDAAFAPAGQWGYLTDPISANSPFTTAERSGVGDVLALPGGGLLVLERELGGALVPDFRSRIYEIGFAGASDVGAFSNLSAGGFIAASKTLLWEGNFGATNFEGLALGPTLLDGSASLFLISDNGSGSAGQTQSLYALRVTGIPEPATGLLLGAGLGLLFGRRRKVQRKPQ